MSLTIKSQLRLPTTNGEVMWKNCSKEVPLKKKTKLKFKDPDVIYICEKPNPNKLTLRIRAIKKETLDIDTLSELSSEVPKDPEVQKKIPSGAGSINGHKKKTRPELEVMRKPSVEFLEDSLPQESITASAADPSFIEFTAKEPLNAGPKRIYVDRSNPNLCTIRVPQRKPEESSVDSNITATEKTKQNFDSTCEFPTDNLQPLKQNSIKFREESLTVLFHGLEENLGDTVFEQSRISRMSTQENSSASFKEMNERLFQVPERIHIDGPHPGSVTLIFHGMRLEDSVAYDHPEQCEAELTCQESSVDDDPNKCPEYRPEKKRRIEPSEKREEFGMNIIPGETASERRKRLAIILLRIARRL